MQTTVQTAPQPGLWRLFLIWTSIGLQSFGGGSSTVYLIQREFILKRDWMTMEEYIHDWSLCMFAPGVNLIALTILIGKKLGGTWGVALSLLGMLLPSSLVTCLLTVLFTQIEQFSATQAVLKGILPATGGVMLLVGFRFAQAPLKTAYQEGKFKLVVSIILITASFLAIVFVHVPVFLLLPGVGLLGVLFFTLRKQPMRVSAEEVQTEQEEGVKSHD